jgi:hypothetical protein
MAEKPLLNEKSGPVGTAVERAICGRAAKSQANPALSERVK